MANQTTNFGTTQLIHLGFARSGHNFGGWRWENGNGGVRYQNQANINVADTTYGGLSPRNGNNYYVDLVATWTPSGGYTNGGGNGGDPIVNPPPVVNPPPGGNNNNDDDDDDNNNNNPNGPNNPGGNDPYVPPGPNGPGNNIVSGGTDANGWPIYIEIDGNGVPLGEWRWNDDDGLWLYDPIVPLATMNLPRTGYNDLISLSLIIIRVLCLISLAGLAYMNFLAGRIRTAFVRF